MKKSDKKSKKKSRIVLTQPRKCDNINLHYGAEEKIKYKLVKSM